MRLPMTESRGGHLEQIANAREQMNKALQGDLERKGLGDLAFVEAAQKIRFLGRYADHVPMESLEYLPVKSLNAFRDVPNKVCDLASKIGEFSLEEGDVPARRNKLVNEIEAQFESAVGQLAPAIALAEALNPVASSTSIKASEALEGARALAEKCQGIVDDLVKKKSEAEAAVKAAQSAAAKAGSSGHASIFKSEADSRRTESIAWLVAFVFAVALSFAAVAQFLFEVDLWVFSWMRESTGPADLTADVGSTDPSPRPSWTADHLASIIARGAAVSLLLYVTGWCGKQYRAQRHLQAVARHRQQALDSFKAFGGFRVSCGMRA